MKVLWMVFDTYLFFLFFLNTAALSNILSNVFTKGCFIPRGTDQVARALLLQQCLSENDVSGNETVCYGQLGCFPMKDPWTSTLRPFPTPVSPEKINVGITLYTRSKLIGHDVNLWPDISLNGSDFDPSRPRTVFIIHGFWNDGRLNWLLDLKDAFLERIDANVFVVDWGDGAKKVSYLQVASNTRVVGAELARFGKYIVGEMGVKKSSLHLLGHSLGSHVCSYMAKGLQDSTKVGRITALDPAQPGFEGTDQRVRLSEEDSDFIDVIHTDAKPFIPFFGFGMLSAVGHVDFYINGGLNQPGCLPIDPTKLPKITSIADLGLIPVEAISKFVACSHSRAYELFTAAIRNQNRNQNCTTLGRKMSSLENIAKISSLGTLALFDSQVIKEQCTSETCTIVGLDTPLIKARGAFSVPTSGKPPYCNADSKMLRILLNPVSKVFQGITSIVSKASSGFGIGK